MHKVVIVQEYVPHYRVALFERMIRLGQRVDLEIIIAAGAPSGDQAARSDQRQIPEQRVIRQRELRILNRRVAFRDVSSALRDADFVVLEQARRNIDAYFRLLQPRRTTPVALWGHGRDFTHSPGLIDTLIQRELTTRSDWFFAYTSQGERAVASYGFEADRITVLNNTTDSSALIADVQRIPEETSANFARKHDLRGATALFLGGLDASKRIDFLLESAELVHNKNRDFRLLIAGRGAEDAKVRAFADKHDWCKWLGQTLGAEKGVALANSQAIAMPGRVGLVAIDSFASGVPIVTTDWPFHAPEFEYLEPNSNALVSADRVDLYAEALRGLLSDDGRLRALSDGARRVSSLYSIEKMAERYVAGLVRWRSDPFQDRRSARKVHGSRADV